MNEESPEVEKDEKESYGCWICEERMGFKKLVTHLRNHSHTEKMLAYTTQVTAERKERDAREKNGKARQHDPHLPETASPLREIGTDEDGRAIPGKKVRRSSKRNLDVVPVLPVREPTPDVQHLEAKTPTVSPLQKTRAADIASL